MTVTTQWLVQYGVAIVGVPLLTLMCASPGRPDDGETVVLEDVPYLGMDWQTYLSGPQDFSLSSAMRAVMLYLGEPQERDYQYYLAISGRAYQQVWQPETGRVGFDDPWLMDADPGHAVRRMFAAAGYAYRIAGIPGACEAMEAPVAALTEQVDADALRAAVCPSIDAGRPAILLGNRPCAVVAGYEQGGKALVGWAYVFEPEKTEYDRHGYVRMPDWLDWAWGAVIVGEKGEPPPIRETYRDALLWAVNAARAPRIGEWVGGLDTLDLWAQALTPDPELDPDDADAFEHLFEAHDCTAMTLAEGRAYGGNVLRRVADLEPDAAEDLQAAGRCHGLIHDLMWRIWQTPEGSWPGNASRERFADLEVEALDALEEVLVAEGQATGRQLEGVNWQGRYVNHLGAIKSCLDYLGIDISRGWLFGGTAHAFIINMRETVCVSAPTAWNTEMLFDLAPNLGYRAEGVKVSRETAGDAFPDRQREAWNLVRSSIDQGLPCYGFELEHPDFYVIYGYDDEDYLFTGWADGRRPWRDLGTYDLALLEVYSVRPCDPAGDDKVVRDALAAAIKFAQAPGDWVMPAYVSGPEAFDLWADELASGRAIYDSQQYNAVFWHECREAAVEFLKEAKQRLAGRCDAAFDEAITHYTVVRDRLKALVDLHRERERRDWQEKLKSPQGAALVREAAAAEREGLACLKEVVAAL